MVMVDTDGVHVQASQARNILHEIEMKGHIQAYNNIENVDQGGFNLCYGEVNF